MSPRLRITIGLASLLMSVLLGAMVLRIVPDQRQAVTEGRSRLCEAMAVNSSVMVSRQDMNRLQAILTVLVERHEDILSAGIRRADGRLVVAIEDHAERWHDMQGDVSDDSQIYVPLQGPGGKWGGLEVCFTPTHGDIWFEMTHSPWVRMIGFVLVLSCGLWYWYLGKVLAQFHPSQAVPRRVRSALDTLSEGLLVLDRKGRIVLCNQALSQVLGEDHEALVGRAAKALPWLGDPSIGPVMSFPWDTVLSGEQTFGSATLRLADAEGQAHIYQTNCSTVYGQDGKNRGAVCSFEDVTALESQKVELAHSKASAEAANKAKSEFLANMSHEIRTPMNAILGFTEVLRRGMYDSDEQRLEYVETIRSSGQHLLRLLNDILDLSKVEAGKLEVEQIACSPLELLVDVVTVLRVRAEERGIYLKLEAPDGLPEQVDTDPGRVRQIITNLVGNAIKFTEHGGVTVAARVRCEAQTFLQIDVTDTGVGIPESSIGKIFQPFTQADGSVTRKFGGTGLGLTISRQLAQALGGDIVVTSTVGAGSTFSITLAIPDASLSARIVRLDEFLTAKRSRRTIVQGQRYLFPTTRVLLVDDTEANRQLIHLFLKRNNIEVETATNGQEAVDAANAATFDIILMDMQMPVMDGYTATRLLRDQGYTRPIVALTAGAMKGDEEKCRAAGCSGFLTKPVDLDELLAYLAELMQAAPVTDAVPAIVASTPTPTASVQAEATLLQNVKDLGQQTAAAAAPNKTTSRPRRAPIKSSLPFVDAEFVKIVIDFVAKMREQIHQLQLAWDRRDLEEVARLAHWLKGAAGTVGFREFTEPALDVMRLIKEQRLDEVGPKIDEITGMLSAVVVPSVS